VLVTKGADAECDVFEGGYRGGAIAKPFLALEDAVMEVRKVCVFVWGQVCGGLVEGIVF
jgi:hypothetical protein